MSRKSTCAISSSISFLSSADIWIHIEMPDATILSSRLAMSRGKLAWSNSLSAHHFFPEGCLWRRTSFLDYCLAGEGNPSTLRYCCPVILQLGTSLRRSPCILQHVFKGLRATGVQGSVRLSRSDSVLLFLAEFLESRIAAQGVPDWIEPQKGRRNRRAVKPATIWCL